MRRDEGSSGSQANREDMERMAGATGATGATSTGMQDSGYQQPGGTQPTASYGQGRAPAPAADYGQAGYDRPAPSRVGSALSILAGALAFLEGLAFVIRSHFYPIVPGYAYRWTLHGWGWTLLVLGALLFAGGVSSFLGIRGSRQFTAALAVITAVVSFLVIFYSAVWSIVVVAACAFAAYSLLTGREDRYGADATGSGAGGQSYGSTGQGSDREQAMSPGRGSHRM